MSTHEHASFFHGEPRLLETQPFNSHGVWWQRHPRPESWRLESSSPRGPILQEQCWGAQLGDSWRREAYLKTNTPTPYCLRWATVRFRNSDLAYSRSIFFKALLSQSEKFQKLFKSRKNILKSYTGCHTTTQWYPLFTSWSIVYQSWLLAYVYFYQDWDQSVYTSLPQAGFHWGIRPNRKGYEHLFSQFSQGWSITRIIPEA